MKDNTRISASKVFFLAAVFFSTVLCALLLTSCGSSTATDIPQPTTTPSTLWQGGPVQEILPLQGTWVQGRCTAISGGSVRPFYTITKTATNQIHLDGGNLFYSGNSSCSGTGANAGSTSIGNALFSGTDDYGTKKYYYSTLRMVSGLEQNYIFAFKNSTVLCVFNRTSDLKTAQDVNAFVNAINSADCYSNQTSSGDSLNASQKRTIVSSFKSSEIYRKTHK